MAGDRGYQYVQHSEACRHRLEEAVMGDENFRLKLESANARCSHRIARELERRDKINAEDDAKRAKASGHAAQGGMGGQDHPETGTHPPGPPGEPARDGGREGYDDEGDDSMGIPLATSGAMSSSGPVRKRGADDQDPDRPAKVQAQEGAAQEKRPCGEVHSDEPVRSRPRVEW